MGIGVALTKGVEVSAGGGAVGDVISCPTFCKAVQPETKIDNRRIGMIFFMEDPLQFRIKD